MSNKSFCHFVVSIFLLCGVRGSTPEPPKILSPLNGREG